jgi:ElaB/YqjD/DUF883 family membrane-anchored ribosome-binding protein
MDHEAEMIKQQMEEKREDLTKKLEQLENQVVETVQSTTSAVTGTVENVKEVVQETVQTVKGSVEETVDSVKKTFDLSYQVGRHPWLMLGGSVAVGFVAGRLVEGVLPPAQAGTYYSEALPPPSTGGVRTDGGERATWYREEAAPRRSYAGPVKEAVSQAGGLLNSLAEQFAPELDKLKGLALGALFGLARDMVKRSVPGEMGGRISEMLDGVTQKLGGEPFKGPVVPGPAEQEGPQRQPGAATAGRGQSGVPPFNRL